jgi:hypothetical protein
MKNVDIKHSLRSFPHILVTSFPSQIHHILIINHPWGYRFRTFNNPLWLYAVIGFLYVLDSKAMSVANQKYFTDFYQQLCECYVTPRHISYIIKNMQNNTLCYIDITPVNPFWDFSFLPTPYTIIFKTSSSPICYSIGSVPVWPWLYHSKLSLYNITHLVSSNMLSGH